METAKGVKDYQPKEQFLREKLLEVATRTYKKYGFNPLQTPIIEREETLTNKYAGGEEILKEIYTLKDQGKRNLALRYDLTVPLGRYIKENPEIKLPFKRYQYGSVFRDGPVKKGRFREFVQCDADVIGNKDLYAEAELLKMMSEIFEELKLKIKIKYNNIKLLKTVLKNQGVKNLTSTILTLDKLEKIGEKGVIKELKEKKEENPEKIIKAVRNSRKENCEGLRELEEFENYLKYFDVKVTEFDPTLARGLAYYTGAVFEAFLVNSEFKSSVAAGGRYDDMIGKLSGRDYPAVGVSFGVDATLDAIMKNEQIYIIDVCVISIKEPKKSIEIANYLRKNNVNTEIILNKNMKKALSFASHYNVKYSLFVGEEEIKQEKYTLRDMKSGEEKKLSLKEIILQFNA
ncbi:MAG: histidine--tRNA ligase [Candidatus Woesearchaeota archaeon]